MKDLSKKNPYWIEHHRYLELEHFCRQYPIWCKAVTAMCGLSSKTYADVVIDEDHSSPVEKSVIKRESYMNKIYDENQKYEHDLFERLNKKEES